MGLRLGMVTVDTTDAASLAAWWAAQLGAEVVMTNDGWFEVLAGPGLPCLLAFQQVEEVTPGKNSLHLDLTADDLDAEVARLEGAGARLVERRREGDFPWATMSDPAGHLFDVAGDHEAVAALG